MSDKRLPALSLDATGCDWLKPPIRVGDDGAIHVRDLAVVSGTRRIGRGTAEWRQWLADLDPGERARALDYEPGET